MTDASVWNRYSFGGTPFLTNGAGEASTRLKPSLSASFLARGADDPLLLLHLFLSGAAMYLLLRELGPVPRLASSAVAWMFSSHTFGWLRFEYIG